MAAGRPCRVTEGEATAPSWSGTWTLEPSELSFSFLLLPPCLPTKQKWLCDIDAARGPGPSPEARESPPFTQAFTVGALGAGVDAQGPPLLG